METISRRSILSAAASGGLLTAAASAQTSLPQPERPGRGGTDPGPRNLGREQQNLDIFVPPSTDQGTLPNLRFSFSDAHMRLETGGWTRQVTARELGVSKDIAGVNMRLNAGGVRELHWHKAAEWAYMLYGTARITAVDGRGLSFVDDVGVGDIVVFSSRDSPFDSGSIRTDANFFSSSTMATSTKTIRFSSPIGSSIRRTRCSPRILGADPPSSDTRQILVSVISFPRPCRTTGR